MRLFGPKLTNEQRATLRAIADAMNSLADEQQASFERTSAQLQEFGANCLAGQRQGLGRPLITPEDGDIETVRQRVVAHQEILATATGKLRAIQFEDWTPAKIVKTREEWVGFWETQETFIDTTLAGLASPEPLVDRAGEAKLNMFLSGFSLAGTMARSWKRVKA